MDLFLEDVKSHFKLDFIDKIIICIVFILGAVLSPVFADDVEDVDTIQVRGISISSSSSEFLEDSTQAVRYVLLEKGYQYTFSFGSTTHYIVLSEDIPDVGVPFSLISRSSGDFIYTAYDDTYIALSYNGFGAVPVTRVPLNGQESAISNLSSIVGFDSIWSTFNFAIPYIAVVVLCVIGLLFIKRLIMSLSKGKARI